MDKQKIIATVNPKKKKTNRKEAAAKIREQSFNQAYLKNREEEKDQDNQSIEANNMTPTNGGIVEETTSFKNAEIPAQTAQEDNPPDELADAPEQKTTTRRGTKKGKKKDGVGDFTYATISVHQNVSKVVKLASTLLEANKIDFTTEAVRYYIKHLKKTGKLPDMPSLDL